MEGGSRALYADHGLIAMRKIDKNFIIHSKHKVCETNNFINLFIFLPSVNDFCFINKISIIQLKFIIIIFYGVKYKNIEVSI